MTELRPQFVVGFVRAIAVLALPPDDQIAYLSTLGDFVGVDELALEFDDGFLLAQQFVDAGWISAETYEGARLLDEQLAELTGAADDDLWTTDALAAAPEWASIRAAAAAVLFTI